MFIAIDLHIHTALSPCADDDMTPNNIVNMAIIKGLDAIAITDHNSSSNVEAVIKAADGRIIVVPGMEVQTREDVHILCYFRDIKSLKLFQKYIDDKKPHLKNSPEIFGHQLIFDEKDQVVGEEDELLLSSVDIPINELVDCVRNLNGAVIPAHIDKTTHGIIGQLGFIPPDLSFNLTEISQKNPFKNSCDTKLKYIISSDAHFLYDILERIMLIDVEKNTIPDIISYINRPFGRKSLLVTDNMDDV